MNWAVRQNSDGGWAYNRGCSWTEPAALVLLAQLATGINSSSLGFARGVNYLRAQAGRDGGFRPQVAVEESTWVTAVVALLPPEILGTAMHARALGWLKERTGHETNSSPKLRGWPWFPGASAWVIPTSFAIIAFEKQLKRQDDPALRERVNDGRAFLRSRMCADGGWNHGSSRALGVDSDSYPETTGIALVALNGTGGLKAEAAARRHLASCRTAEGTAWLRMALGIRENSGPVCRTNTDAALTALAMAGGFA